MDIANTSLAILDMFLLDSNKSEDEEADFCEVDSHPGRLVFIFMGTLIALLGVICNAMLLYVFTFKAGKSSSCNLTTLAALDFLFCVLYLQLLSLDKVAVTLEIECKTKFIRKKKCIGLYDYVWQTKVFTYCFSKMVMMAIPYVLIASSVERFSKVDGRSQITNSSNRLAVLIFILLVVVLLRAPTFLSVRVLELSAEKCTPFTRRSTVSTELFDNSEFLRNFELVVQFLHTCVSFVVLLMINALIVAKSCKIHQRARRQSSCPALLLGVGVGHSRSAAEEEARREHKRLRCAVKTTVVIISSYLICNLIHVVLYIYEQFYVQVLKEYNYFSPAYEMWSDIGSDLFILSSATRLFIYYKYNPDVRDQLRGLSCPSPTSCPRFLHNEAKYIQKPTANGVSV